MGERCPFFYPSADDNTAMPQSARLSETSIENGRRRCVYEQGSHRWTRDLPITENCPLNGGMIAADEPGGGQ